MGVLSCSSSLPSELPVMSKGYCVLSHLQGFHRLGFQHFRLLSLSGGPSPYEKSFYIVPKTRLKSDLLGEAIPGSIPANDNITPRLPHSVASCMTLS